MKTDVHAWLSSRPRDYLSGVNIFLRYTTNHALIALFQEDETDFKREKLYEVMQGLVGAFEESPTIPTTVTESTDDVQPYSVEHKGWPNPITDPVIQSLWEQWKPLFAELQAHKGRIYEVALQGEKGDITKEMEAGGMAHRIVELDREIQSIYRDRAHYQEHGRLSDKQEKSDLITDPVKWVIKLKNAERYVREFRGKITRANDLLITLQSPNLTATVYKGLLPAARKILPKKSLKNWNKEKAELINIVLGIKVGWELLLKQHHEDVAYYKRILKLDV